MSASPAQKSRTRAPALGLTVLGSTGSIGQQTLEVVHHLKHRYKIVALTAGRNLEKLAEQANALRPELVVVSAEADAKTLRAQIPAETKIAHGLEGVLAAVSLASVHTVMAAMVGAAGLLPTLFALKSGKRVALANKEALVMAGALVTQAAKESGQPLLPVDSEHSAIWQCTGGKSEPKTIRRIWLTATGGPFRGKKVADLAGVTVAQALNHPVWKMGKKISVDSATLMNKGLEVIEAKWLFEVPVDRIEVLIHPQGTVHSMVEFVDGSVLAQLGTPDMRLPIHVALTYPDRVDSTATRLTPMDLTALTFERPDPETFRCLPLAVRAGRESGSAPAILNGANEAAVSLFLAGKLSFLEIPKLIDDVLSRHKRHNSPTLEEILEADRWAREETYAAASAKAADSAVESA